ncbi:MAG: hypothetical protein WCG25_07145 [bacterium]
MEKLNLGTTEIFFNQLKTKSTNALFLRYDIETFGYFCITEFRRPCCSGSKVFQYSWMAVLWFWLAFLLSV